MIGYILTILCVLFIIPLLYLLLAGRNRKGGRHPSATVRSSAESPSRG